MKIIYSRAKRTRGYSFKCSSLFSFKGRLCFLFLLTYAVFAGCSTSDGNKQPDDAPKPLSPAEAVKSFHLPAGFRITSRVSWKFEDMNKAVMYFLKRLFIHENWHAAASLVGRNYMVNMDCRKAQQKVTLLL